MHVSICITYHHLLTPTTKIHTYSMAMASRAAKYWRSFARTGTRRVHAVGDHPIFKPKMDYVPVCVALGLIVVSATLGLNTARLQLAYSPNVLVDKKKRETVPEVAIPDWALEEAKNLIRHSLFRKVAHLQDFDAVRAGIPDPTRGPISEHTSLKAETLKDVGVDPPGIDQTRAGRIRGLVDTFFNKKNNA